MNTFNNLTPSEQAIVENNIARKRTINFHTKLMGDDKSLMLAIVKKYDGVEKDGDIVSYVSQAQDKMVFNLEQFQKEHPRLAKKYMVAKPGACEHIAFNLK